MFAFTGEKHKEVGCLKDKKRELEVRKDTAHLGGEHEEPSEPATEGINDVTAY